MTLRSAFKSPSYSEYCMVVMHFSHLTVRINNMISYIITIWNKILFWKLEVQYRYSKSIAYAGK